MMTLRVEQASKDKMRRWAERGDLSMSALFDQILQRVEETPDGMPVWLPAVEREGELPFSDT